MTRTAVASTAELKLHTGNTLLLIADRYAKVHDVLLEWLQNMLDSNASRALFVINLKKRRILAYDDGDGATREEFNEALAEVARSQKTERRHRVTGKRLLGRFGLAIVSPLNKCDRFTFSSRPSKARGGRSGFLRWTFVTEDLSQCPAGENPQIPVDERPELDTQPWNTMVVMNRLIDDRSITHIELETLISAMCDNFSRPILDSGMKITIEFTDENGVFEKRDVVPRQFEGEALAPWVGGDRNSGVVTLTMFQRIRRANPLKLRLQFGIADDEFRVSWQKFLRRHRDHFSADTVRVLSSGLFEGDIVVERCKLLQERNGFVEDDAFLGLCLALDEWCSGIGIEAMQDAEFASRQERYQEAGKRALEHLTRIIGDNEAFKSVVAGFAGSVADRSDREGPRGKVMEGRFTTPTTIADAGEPGGGTQGSPTYGVSKTPKLAVAGPKGRRRVIVRGACGLCIEYEPMPGSRKRFSFDEKSGLLRLNVRHPDFTRCEDSPRRLADYQAYACIWVITLHAEPSYARRNIEEIEDNWFSSIVALWSDDPMEKANAAREEKRRGRTKAVAKRRRA